MAHVAVDLVMQRIHSWKQFSKYMFLCFFCGKIPANMGDCLKAIFQKYNFVFLWGKIHANMGGCLFWEGIYFMSWMSLTDISVCHLRKCWNHKELDKSFIQYFHIIHMDTSYCLTQHLSSFEEQYILWLLLRLLLVLGFGNDFKISKGM